MTESFWAALPTLDLTTLEPRPGETPRFRSTIRVGHSGTSLLLGFWFETVPGGAARSGSVTRDRLGSSDVMRLLLDTFADHDNGVGFATTPSGNQVDFTVSGDGRAVDFGWNGVWTVVTSVDSAGWGGEFEVPFSTLRFQVRDGVVRMGVIAARFDALGNELAIFPAIGPSIANPVVRPSAAQPIAMAGVEAGLATVVAPYAAADYERLAPFGGPAVATRAVEFGGDLKIALRRDLTADLTVNTDFAQVEVDDQRVNLSRFSLFFPEKRQFFLERAGIFSLPTGALDDPSQFFHSRRIGLSPTGEPLAIHGGGRVVGRLGSWDLGVLDLEVAEAGRARRGENIGVVRVRRRVFNPESNLGVILTRRNGDDRFANTAVALDARVRVTKREYLAGYLAASDDPLPVGRETGLGRGGARLMFERPSSLSTSGFAFAVGMKWSGPGFRPGLGFEQRTDYTHQFVNLRYGVLTAGSPVRLIQPSLAVSRYRRNADGETESAFGALFLNYSLRSGANGWVGVSRRTERLGAPLPLGDDPVPAGVYRYPQLSFNLEAGAGDRFQWGISGSAGRLYDGRLLTLGATPSYTVSAALTAGLEFERTTVSFPNGRRRFRSDVVRGRVTFAPTPRLSGSAFVQYNTVAELLVPNVRLRYRFGEGRDLYLVYDDQLSTEERAFGSPALRSVARGLVMKYTHQFGLSFAGGRS